MIANQRLKAALSPEVRILSPVSSLNGDAAVAVGRLQSAGGAVGIIEWLPAEWRLREVRTVNEASSKPDRTRAFVSPPPLLLRFFSDLSPFYVGLLPMRLCASVCVCVCTSF